MIIIIILFVIGKKVTLLVHLTSAVVSDVCTSCVVERVCQRSIVFLWTLYVTEAFAVASLFTHSPCLPSLLAHTFTFMHTPWKHFDRTCVISEESAVCDGMCDCVLFVFPFQFQAVQTVTSHIGDILHLIL